MYFNEICPLTRLGEGDSGNYSCLPSNAENDTVIVHVLEGLGEAKRLKDNLSCM
jgi:hypothetical protein